MEKRKSTIGSRKSTIESRKSTMSSHQAVLEIHGSPILSLPKKIMLKIFSYLDIDDFSNTWHVCLHFQIVTKEIVRSRWKSLLPSYPAPRSSILRPQGSSKQLKESQIVFQNPFNLEISLVDVLQIPSENGIITSITTSDPSSILLIGTSKGSICAYSFPLNRHSQLELVDTVETGLEDMKIVAGNKHIYAISKKSCLVSIYDFETLKPVSTLGIKTDTRGLLNCLDYDRNTQLVVTGDLWGTCNVWDTRSSKHVFEGISTHSKVVERVCLQGDYFLAVNGTATLWNIPGRCMERKEGVKNGTYCDGGLCEEKKYFVVGSREGVINLFPFNSSQAPSSPGFGNIPIKSLSLYSDLLLVSDCTGSTFLYDVPYSDHFSWKVKPLSALNHTPNFGTTFFHPGFIATFSDSILKTWNYIFEDSPDEALFHIMAHNPHQSSHSNTCLIQ